MPHAGLAWAAQSLSLPSRLGLHRLPPACLPPLQWTASLSFPTQAPGQSLMVRLPSGTDPNYYVQGAPVSTAQHSAA